MENTLINILPSHMSFKVLFFFSAASLEVCSCFLGSTLRVLSVPCVSRSVWSGEGMSWPLKKQPASSQSASLLPLAPTFEPSFRRMFANTTTIFLLLLTFTFWAEMKQTVKDWRQTSCVIFNNVLVTVDKFPHIEGLLLYLWGRAAQLMDWLNWCNHDLCPGFMSFLLLWAFGTWRVGGGGNCRDYFQFLQVIQSNSVISLVTQQIWVPSSKPQPWF